MARKQIPCGGFYYDDTQFEFIDGELKSKGNGGGFDVEFTLLKEYSSQFGYQYELIYTKGDYDSIIEKLENHLLLSSNCGCYQWQIFSPAYIYTVSTTNDEGSELIVFQCKQYDEDTIYNIYLHPDNTWEVRVIG